MYLWLPNIKGQLASPTYPFSHTQPSPLWIPYTDSNYINSGSQSSGTSRVTFDASKVHSIYTDNGKVLPLSISKQSYIIYK